MPSWIFRSNLKRERAAQGGGVADGLVWVPLLLQVESKNLTGHSNTVSLENKTTTGHWGVGFKKPTAVGFKNPTSPCLE